MSHQVQTLKIGCPLCNGDRYRHDVTERTSLNTTDTQRGHVGFSFHSSRYPSFYFTFDMTKQETRKGSPFLPEDISTVGHLSSDLYLEFNKKIAEYVPISALRQNS